MSRAGFLRIVEGRHLAASARAFDAVLAIGDNGLPSGFKITPEGLAVQDPRLEHDPRSGAWTLTGWTPGPFAPRLTAIRFWPHGPRRNDTPANRAQRRRLAKEARKHLGGTHG